MPLGGYSTKPIFGQRESNVSSYWALRNVLIHARIEIYLPEPGSLQESEGAAQQLQKDVTSVEDLQEGNKSTSKDGIEKELMYVDVQHTPAMEVVEEKKSCQAETQLSMEK